MEFPKMRKIDLGVPSAQAFKDTLVDHCWFIDGKNDPIKKVYAIVYKQQLFFPEHAIKQNMSSLYSILGHVKRF